MLNIKEIVTEYMLKDIDKAIYTLIIKFADDNATMERLSSILTTHIDSIHHFISEETEQHE